MLKRPESPPSNWTSLDYVNMVLHEAGIPHPGFVTDMMKLFYEHIAERRRLHQPLTNVEKEALCSIALEGAPGRRALAMAMIAPIADALSTTIGRIRDAVSVV